MYSQIYVYIAKCLYLAKKLWRGTCTELTSHKSRTFSWGGAACSRRRPIQGCLGIARNMGNRGADAPTGTSEPICLRHSIQASTASIRTSDSHPIGALSVCSAPNSAENLIDTTYTLSSVMLHVLVTLIRRGNASMKKCSALGVSRTRWCSLQSAAKLKISY